MSELSFLSLNHDLASILDIHALGGGLAVELPSVKRVGCAVGAALVSRYADDSCKLAASVAEVQHEGAGGLYVFIDRLIGRHKEVAAEGFQRSWVLRVAQCAAAPQHEDLVQVALVVARSAAGYDAERRVLAYELTVAACIRVVGERHCRWSRCGDDHISEHGIAHRAACALPLHDVRLSSLDTVGCGEVQRQCTIGGQVRCRGIQFLDDSPVERMRRCGHLLSTYVERQAQRVPIIARLRQRTTGERHVIDFTVSGIGNGAAVVGIVAEREAEVVGAQGLAVDIADVAAGVLNAVLVVERLARCDGDGV